MASSDRESIDPAIAQKGYAHPEALVVALIVAIAVSQRSGPRVTRIETRHESEDRKDGDDA
jgi:hypothetical protein